MSLTKLYVSEIFLSLQGEGISMGVPSIFLRLGGCNLLCGGQGTQHDGKLHNEATWRCDTIEVWQQSKGYEFQDLLDKMNLAFDFEKKIEQGFHLIITGGEPLLQQEAIGEFIKWLMLKEEGKGIFPFIEIETNGTIYPNSVLQKNVDQWNVSPKLNNSGENHSKRIIPTALNYFIQSPVAIFKFVVSKPTDWNEIRTYHIIHQECKDKIWLMPAASNQEELVRNSKIVAEICIREGVNFSSRLQIGIWNETVGV